MIYFDNAATTFPNEEVLNTFVQVTKQFLGNPNAMHQLGFEAKKLMDEATRQVADLFHVKEKEIIFTSCASESNNLAIQGILKSYPYRKKKIVTTPMEHASLQVLFHYLEKQGVEIAYLKLQKDGKIDLDDLQQKLKEEPLIVSIQHVNSEVGIIQDIETIGKLIKQCPKTFFHVDATQSVGKISLHIENVDLLSCSAHKFFGLKGIACLVKRENVELTPLIFGGKSQSVYRAGTPSVALIASFAKALRLALKEVEQDFQQVEKLKNHLEQALGEMKDVVVNSFQNGSPYIVNFSVLSVKSETLLHALSEKEVYLSTKTACSKEDKSDVLVALQKSDEVATHSLRVSFCKYNTEEEVNQFLNILKKEIAALNLKKGAN